MNDEGYDMRLTAELENRGGYANISDPLDLIIDVAIEMVENGKCHTYRDRTPFNVPEPVTAYWIEYQCAYEETVQDLQYRFAKIVGQDVEIDWDQVGIVPQEAFL